MMRDWEERFRAGLQHQADRAATTPEMQQRLARSLVAAGQEGEPKAKEAGAGPVGSHAAATPFMGQRSWLQRLHDFWHGETEISLQALVGGASVVAVAVVLVAISTLQSVPDLIVTDASWKTVRVEGSADPQSGEGGVMDESSYSYPE